MNPGPFGMAQTGVPPRRHSHGPRFIGVEGRVDRPEREHLHVPSRASLALVAK